MSDNIIQVNQEIIHTELKDLVCASVEEALNAMLDAKADRLVNADRYARDEKRQAYRSGHYDRSFTTSSGEVTLKMPKLKGLTFETSIIERYKRRETSVEEALIEMYLAGVSVRRVEDISEALWGTKSLPVPSAISTRKLMITLKNGEIESLQRSILTFLLTAYISKDAGTVNLKTAPY